MNDDERLVSAANRAFYTAFAARDFAAMDRLWARLSPVACIHPGWPAIFKREAVMASWRSILGNPGQAAVAGSNERVMVNGDIAIVICDESVGGGALVATNVFAREGGEWRMIHHQAGPRTIAQPRQPPPDPSDSKRQLH